MESKPLKAGDPCPNCDGALRRAKVPTDAQRAAANAHSEPTPIPAHYDTASEDFRTEHGELVRCDSCGYAGRVPIKAAKSAAAKAEA